MNGMVLYARREPTSDVVLQRLDPHAARRRFDVVIYRDPQATQPAARYPWFYRSKPRRGDRSVVHNCARFQLAWLPTS